MMVFDLWDYNYKKNVTLKKHMAIKHQDNNVDGNDERFSEDKVVSLSEIKHHKDKKLNQRKVLCSASPCWTNFNQ